MGFALSHAALASRILTSAGRTLERSKSKWMSFSARWGRYSRVNTAGAGAAAGGAGAAGVGAGTGGGAAGADVGGAGAGAGAGAAIVGGGACAAGTMGRFGQPLASSASATHETMSEAARASDAAGVVMGAG